jgi:hypothetical protein
VLGQARELAESIWWHGSKLMNTVSHIIDINYLLLQLHPWLLSASNLKDYGRYVVCSLVLTETRDNIAIFCVVVFVDHGAAFAATSSRGNVCQAFKVDKLMGAPFKSYHHVKIILAV